MESRGGEGGGQGLEGPSIGVGGFEGVREWGVWGVERAVTWGLGPYGGVSRDHNGRVTY